MGRQRNSRGYLHKSKTKPQRWLGDWYVYRIVDGKEKRVHRGPKVLGLCAQMTRFEAQKRLDELIETERAADDQVPADDPDLLWMWKKYAELKASKWGAQHAENFEYQRRQIISKHAIGRKKLASITRSDCQDLLNRLSDSYGYSLLHKIRTNLKAVFDEAIEMDLLMKNPARKLDVPASAAIGDQRALSEDECTRLLAACEGRDHLIIRIFLSCGLRPSELFALRRDDIEPGRLRVDEVFARYDGLRRRLKTRSSRGYVPMAPGLEAELRTYLRTIPDQPDQLLFESRKAGTPVHPNNFLRRSFRAVLERAGLVDIDLRSLRRTTATHAAPLGSVKDAQAILRHARPNVTAEIYMQPIDEHVRAVAEQLDQKLCGKETKQ